MAQLKSASHKTSSLFHNILPFRSISDFELIFPRFLSLLLLSSSLVTHSASSFFNLRPHREQLHATCWGRSKHALLRHQVSGRRWQNWLFFHFLPGCFRALQAERECEDHTAASAGQHVVPIYLENSNQETTGTKAMLSLPNILVTSFLFP